MKTLNAQNLTNETLVKDIDAKLRSIRYTFEELTGRLNKTPFAILRLRSGMIKKGIFRQHMDWFNNEIEPKASILFAKERQGSNFTPATEIKCVTNENQYSLEEGDVVLFCNEVGIIHYIDGECIEHTILGEPAFEYSLDSASVENPVFILGKVDTSNKNWIKYV